ncbi:MAG: DM13 domain-containing protein [Flammeovirgaceae bacterium]|nr:DM13 domain-containing protein [Flammeovirgaceae bacterium]
MTENGPDLKIYLSLNESATNYINLGDLKSTTGKQSYDIPDNTVISDQMYVHVWCQDFSVNFGQAKLQ